MDTIEFIYNEKKIEIQCYKDDKMEDIINKYIIKSSINKNSVIFLYSGNKIDEELKLSEIIGKEKKILVIDLKDYINNNKSIIQSKYIICPKCGENIRIKIHNYQIYLYECKNGHRINNILLNEFEKTQYIDISKIICGKCKEKNKSNTYNNDFYKCITCGINICPLCKYTHDKSHNIINYDLKNYICQKHNELFINFCKKCKKNICLKCKNDHKEHNIISYEDMIPNEIEIKDFTNKLRKSIDILKQNIEEIKNILNKVIENIQIYNKIYNKIINNYDKKFRNYEILQNIKEINYNILDEINKINNDSNTSNKINNIIEIYNKMMNKDISEINIIYDINKKFKHIEMNDDNIINIFGPEFVKNNKNICKMIIDNKEYELKEEYNIKNYNNNILIVKLNGINNVKNMRSMFSWCTTLSSLPDISKWDTNNVTDMSWMFGCCTSLSSLPDISEWNTNNVENMNYMFYGCSSLTSLPDISKWNTINIKDVSGMFYGCSSLSSLPNISKWNTNFITDMKEMFYGCSSLLFLPDISKWNTNNIEDMKEMFYGCSSLSSLPDISKWNTNNINNISNMFYGCSSLSSIPDISKWNVNNLIYMNGIFTGCSSLSSLPDIYKWKANNKAITKIYLNTNINLLFN